MKRLLPRYHCGDTWQAQRRLRGWYRQPLGRRLLETERDLLDTVLPGLFGYHLLQVGVSLERDLYRSTRIPHCMLLDDLNEPAGERRGHTERFYGRATALPVATDSLDVLLLPHILEFEQNPHQVLREADRTLIPEGHLVILGFNPWSLWGLWRLFLGWRRRPPWCGHFFSLHRVKDWLALLGFDTVQVQSYFFRPPLAHSGMMERLRLLERAGGRCWPIWGGGYLLVAKKRVTTLTPIRSRWRPNRRLVAGGVAEPTIRGCNRRSMSYPG